MSKTKTIATIGCSLLSVPFILSASILILASVGLRPGIHVLSRYYTKEPIALRRSLKKFDVSALYSFQSGWEVRSEEATDDFETDEYLILKLTNKNSQQAALFVTYYSDPESKVPHTPDVCYRQAGEVIKKMAMIKLDTPELSPQYPQIPVRLLIFDMQTAKCEQVVMYCFCAEGKIVHTRGQVRWIAGTPGNRYTYFSKIEVAANYPRGGDPTKVIEICKKLLSEALPILLAKHFPDKQQLKRF